MILSLPKLLGLRGYLAGLDDVSIFESPEKRSHPLTSESKSGVNLERQTRAYKTSVDLKECDLWGLV